MLLITNDGRKAALDQRLINPMLPDEPESKVNACVRNVYAIRKRTAEKLSAQMIFCDLSIPKGDGKFNVYDDIREKLIARGIPPEEIAFIHTADTDAKKKGTVCQSPCRTGAGADGFHLQNGCGNQLPDPSHCAP